MGRRHESTRAQDSQVLSLGSMTVCLGTRALARQASSRSPDKRIGKLIATLAHRHIRIIATPKPNMSGFKLVVDGEGRQECHSGRGRNVNVYYHLFAHQNSQGYIYYLTKRQKVQTVQWRVLLHISRSNKKKKRKLERDNDFRQRANNPPRKGLRNSTHLGSPNADLVGALQRQTAHATSVADVSSWE